MDTIFLSTHRKADFVLLVVEETSANMYTISTYSIHSLVPDTNTLQFNVKGTMSIPMLYTSLHTSIIGATLDRHRRQRLFLFKYSLLRRNSLAIIDFSGHS